MKIADAELWCAGRLYPSLLGIAEVECPKFDVGVAVACVVVFGQDVKQAIFDDDGFQMVVLFESR